MVCTKCKGKTNVKELYLDNSKVIVRSPFKIFPGKLSQQANLLP